MLEVVNPCQRLTTSTNGNFFNEKGELYFAGSRGCTDTKGDRARRTTRCPRVAARRRLLFRRYHRKRIHLWKTVNPLSLPQGSRLPVDDLLRHRDGLASTLRLNVCEQGDFPPRQGATVMQKAQIATIPPMTKPMTKPPKQTGRNSLKKFFMTSTLSIFKERSRRLYGGLIDGRQVVIALKSVEDAVGVSGHVTFERDAEGAVKGGIICPRALDELGDIAGVLLVMLALIFSLVSHVITTLAN